MNERFHADVRQHGEMGIIDLKGDLDGDAASALAAAYAEASSGATGVLLNFAPMSFMNSSGIALVVELLAKARVEGRPVHAAGLSDHYRQIFEITRLSDFMTIHPDEASAVA
jgi:anti-anti-sigma factor